MKRVKYNGGTESFYGSSDHKHLVIGKVYEVVDERVSAFHTEYTLKGVPGEYNSVWFDTVEDVPEAFLAVATKIPRVGERCECNKLVIQHDGTCYMQKWRTSIVKEVEEIYTGTYKVTTLNNVYIVSVRYY